MLRWNGNASHFLIAGSGGKSFLKTRAWRLIGLHIVSNRSMNIARRSEAKQGQQPGIVPKRDCGVRKNPLKIGFAQIVGPENQPKLDESVQLD